MSVLEKLFNRRQDKERAAVDDYSDLVAAEVSGTDVDAAAAEYTLSGAGETVDDPKQDM